MTLQYNVYIYYVYILYVYVILSVYLYQGRHILCSSGCAGNLSVDEVSLELTKIHSIRLQC